MPTIADLREQYPELQGLDDDRAIDAIQQAFYPEIPRETIAAKLGYKPPEPPRQPSSTARRMIGDSAVSLAKGVIAVPEAAVGVADLVTGGRAGRAAEAMGFRPREAKEILSGYYSPEQQEAFRQVQAAEGLVDTAGAVVRNPSVIPQTVIESLPAMGAGGVVARGARAVAPAMGAVPAGAVGEGVVAAGMGAEQVRQESPDGLLTPGQSGIVAASGATTGALGMLGGKIAQSLGIADVDTMLAGAARSSMARKSVVRRAVEGFVAEGLLEELPQSLQEQIAQNAATGKPLDDGIDQAAVLGLLSGGVMGAAAQMLPARGPLTRAANAGIQSGAIPVGMPGVEPAAADPIIDTPGLSEQEEAAALGAMERQNSADTSRFGQPRIDDWRLPEAAPDFGPTDTAFVDELRAQAERDQAAAVEDMQAELRRTRVAEAMAAPVERAPRRRIEAQELDLPGPDPVRDYIDAKRAENTPAARAFVKEFEAGRITPADVQAALQRGREPTPDERLARASQQRVEPAGEPSLILNSEGQPFRNQMAVRRAQRSNPNTEIEEVQGGWALRPVSQAQAAPEREWETFGPDTGTKGVPRADMPQIKAGDRSAMVQFLRARGVDYAEEEVQPADLKPTQAEYSPAKVRQAADYRDTDRAILVSQDGHVVDGHHQWLAKAAKGEPVRVIRLNAPINALLPLVREFPSASAADGVPPAAEPNAGAPAPVGADGATVDGGADTPAAPAPSETTDDADQQESPEPEAQAAAGEAPAATGGDRPAGEAEPAAPGPAAVQAARVKKPKAPKLFEKKALAQAPTSALEQPTAEEAPDGLVTIPADESAFAEALRHSRDDDERVRATFEPGIKSVSLPRVSSANAKPEGVEFLTPEQAKARVDGWKAAAKRQGKKLAGQNGNRTVISLFDASGVLAQPWADAGYNVVAYDLQTGSDINDFNAENLLEQHGNDEVFAILAQPPCTDYASSGAQWWKDKDADGRTEASNELVRQVMRTVELFRPSVWVMENPVGRIQKLNKLPDPLLSFDPWHYGDPYSKRTLLWGKFDPNLPTAMVEPTEGSKIHRMSSSAKYERSLTSEPFAYAFFMANNAESIGPAGRLAAEFAGVDRTLFDAALAAGHDERAVRTAIEDSYYESDLETVREALEGLAAARAETGPRVEAKPATADTGDQEPPDDPAPPTSPPPVDRPVDEGQTGLFGDEPVRGARQPRARAGRADDRSLRGARGRAQGADDGQRGLGDGAGDDAVSDRSDGAVERGGRGVSAPDYRPEPGGLTREGSWFATAARNIDLIELAIRIDGEKRAATPDEQAQLSKYVGFGASEIRNNLFPVPSAYSKSQEPNRLIWPNLVREARWKPLAERMEKLPIEWQRSVLQSSQYAHYTSEGIIRSVWSGMQRMGFTGGKVLEPGMGIGSFAMLMPDTVRKTSKYTGVEFDGPTALIARLLSPQQNMLHEDFIKRKFPRDYFDVAVGNPPFSQTKILGDPDYEKFGFMLHDFFFAKSLDRVRPGGLLVFVTSKGTMDKQSDKARKYLADRADLLGAIRLPSTAFEANAGTSVVTDVIFLRKRLPGEAPAGKAWQAVKTIDTKDGPAVVNEYFADHPDMVLGQQRISGNTDDEGRRINSNGMGGEKYTVVSYDKTPAELDAKFASAIERLPANAYSPLSQTSEQVRKETAKVDFDPSVKREGVVYLGKDGALMRVEQGVGKPLDSSVKLSAKDADWFKGYVGIRDAVQAARAAQVQDGDWQAALKTLNKAYDAFRKEHGPVNDFRVQVRKSTDEEGNAVETEIRIFKNRRLFREDYDSAVVTQLETITEGGDIIKAPFLLGRTIGKPVAREVKTIGDALAVSLDETGRLDLDDVARRIHITRADAIEALGNQVFKSPQGDWQLADEYLSGDVVTKLEEAEQAARLDASLDRNVEALKAVQPEKLGPSKISVKVGASWVPARYVSEFASEIGAGAVTFDPKTESWQVEGGNLRSQRKAGLEYGTTDRSPSELLEAVLNSQSITIKRTDAEKKTYTDAAATTAANEAARKIKDKFKSWVWTDADRASELVEVYNKRFNNIAPRRFDGSHMTLPGVSLRFSPHPHQKRAIWRQVQTGNTYLAHAVGAGKTIEMIAGGMEQKRLGLIRKPIYAVPNHMLEQFANEFMELYPLANIMVADDENFSAERRKAFVAAATLNAPDAIIITHSAFERVGVKEETVAPIRDEILLDLQMELDEAKGDRVRRSQLEQQIEAVTQRFDSIAGVGKKDSTIKFEDIGADFVYVDEAHAFRKLDFTTNQKIKGIDPNGSRRALDMYVKTLWLEKERPGRAMVFASGTPVTNTMGELYTIMRFFAPDELARGGISTFDGWARQFGEAVPALEANAAGRYEVVERFAKFDNVPELMSRVRQFMDVLTSEHLGALVKRPDIEGGKPDLITVEPTAALKSYMKTVLLPRLEASRKWKPTKDEPFNPDPVIAITSDGRFAALDPRFFGETIDEDKTPTKLSRMADEVARIYKASAGNDYTGKDGKPEPIKGSTQIVFYNLGFGVQSQKNRGFDARAALNRRMVAQGVKREHILWFDDADTDAKKEAMFKAMRSGQARILVGSAKKMGTGVNVQKRLLALHYFDPPWYPSDVEQPHGRIIRQGNQNPVATIKWYATKGTYDSTMWQMVGRKQRFIDQAFSGDKTLRSMEDMSEASMFEQAAAVASGDPRALQLAGLRQDVERLERLQAAHASEQISVRSALRGAEWNVDIYAKRVSQYAAAVKAIGGSYYAFKTGTVGNRTFEKQTEFGQAVKDAFNRGAADAVVNPGTTTRQVGSLAGGLELRMEADADREGKPNGNHELVLRAGGLDLPIASGAAMDEQVDALGLARRIVNTVNGIDTELSRARSSLSTNETDVTRLRKKLGAPFEYQQELAEKYGDLKRLEEELRAEGEAEAKAAAAPPAPIKIDEDGNQSGEALSIADNPEELARLGAAFSQSFGKPVDAGGSGADTAAYGPATQAHRDVAAAFRERIGRAFPGTLFDAVAPRAGARGRELTAAAVVAKRLFGQEVVFVRFEGAPLFNGAMSDSIANTVFLRADSSRPHLAVLGHELLHRMRKDQPGIYQSFTKRIDVLLDRPGRYLDALRQRYKDFPDKVPTDWMEELRADIVGDFFVDREFWNEMAEQQPGLFRRVVAAIVKFLDDVAAFLTKERPFGTEKFLADVQIARSLVADAMRQYSGAQVGAMTNQSEGISLSIADMADSLRTTATKKGLTDLYNDLTRSQAGFNWWHRTIGTQYAKAKRNADFAKVYDGAQDYLHDTSAFANDAGGQAPDLLPQLKGWQDILRPIALKEADRAAVSKAVFEGTLNWSRGEDGELAEDAGDSPGGVVFTDAELSERFGMTDHQRDLYRQFRAATDRSLDLMAAADVARYLADDLPGPIKQMVSDGDTGRFKGLVMAMLQEQADKEKDGGYWTDAMAAVEQKYERIDDLKARGYAPLMRFGKHSVYVTRQTDAGATEQVYFGLYETQREANQAAREFKATFKDEPVTVQQGLLSEEGYKLFSGMSPETMAVFADLAGMERNEQFEAYLKLALANRSALKRLIRRKGVAGYSEDLSRVLASFVTSNARAASSSLHMGEIAASIGSMQERKVSGDVIDEAIKLKDYVQNPGEEAQAVRGLLFVQYLGGSVASAIVNMTQPATMTFPFLSQFGGPAKAAARLVAGIKQAVSTIDAGSELGRALAKAEKEGIVSPQEIHQLQAEAARNVGNRPWVRKSVFLWGSLFSLAEQFNRRSSFIAAWNTAKEEGIADPFAFAADAVDQTQGVYNKANKPNWARGALGGTLFTFKQFSISYLEFLSRLPPREKALALAVLMLAAGAQGLPGADDLDDLIDTLAQQAGYDFDSRESKARFLTSVLGRGGADFLMHGFSAIPGFPLDVSSRLSVGNLIPGTSLLMKSEPDKGRGMQEILGPAGGFGADLMKMVEQRDVLLAVPVAIRNLAKGLDMMQTSQYSDSRGRKVIETGPVDAVTKMVGFQPADVARESRRLQDRRQRVALVKAVESEIAAEWAGGIVDGKPERVRAARERLQAWNRDNPQSPIAISSGQIGRRVRDMRMTREERFMKTVPRELRPTLQ